MDPDRVSSQNSVSAKSPTEPLRVTPRRKLSWWRLALTLCVLGGTAAVGFVVEQQAVAGSHPRGTASGAWFAPYVDTTLTPLFQFQDRSANPARSVVLGFVVADPNSPCNPSWGGAYSLSGATVGIDLDRRIARLRQQGGSVMVSFGGQANSELALTCTNVSQLATAYRSVITRYHVTAVDFDVEGGALQAPDSYGRRARAVRMVQSGMAKAGKKLAVWLTLPVSPAGLPPEAVSLLRSMLAARVAVTGVNAMAMDFGGSKPASEPMITAAEQALVATQRQVTAAYAAAGVKLSSAAAWAKIGVTPMIGQNDVADEQFSLTAAGQLARFARRLGLSRISMWSLNRDQPCGPNVVVQQTVMNSCSGIDQQPLAFTSVFTGPVPAVPAARSDRSLERAAVDSPRTSPYPIWEPTAGYEAGYKVVWHGYVFEAKWWSQGTAPDTPVAHEWQTPWEVIGPVLPGEHPPVLKRLPAGTYPAWSGTVTYQKGQRVLVDGLAYEAKWWTRGDPPDYQAGNLFDTPWRPLFTIPGEPPAPVGAPPPQSGAPAAP